MIATRLVKYEVVVLLEGDGSVLGIPDAVGEGIKAAIQRAEGEGALSGEQTVAAAHLERVTLMKDDRTASPTSVTGMQFRDKCHPMRLATLIL